MGSKFSSAKPNGSIGAWQPAHRGLLRCASNRWRTDVGLPVSLRSGKGGTSGGGGGGGEPRSVSSTHFPRSTGDVRFGYDVTASRLPCPISPPRSSVGNVTFRNRLPCTFG